MSLNAREICPIRPNRVLCGLSDERFFKQAETINRFIVKTYKEEENEYKKRGIFEEE